MSLDVRACRPPVSRRWRVHGRVDLPLVRPIRSVRAYRESLASPTPPFVRECIERNAAVFDRVPSLDYDGVVATYRAHLARDDRTRVLFALATFLEMPVTHRIAETAS